MVQEEKWKGSVSRTERCEWIEDIGTHQLELFQEVDYNFES